MNNSKILRFPRRVRPAIAQRIPTRCTAEGWVKSCTLCGRHFIQRYMAGTVRGNRAELCLDCWIEAGMFE